MAINVISGGLRRKEISRRKLGPPHAPSGKEICRKAYASRHIRKGLLNPLLTNLAAKGEAHSREGSPLGKVDRFRINIIGENKDARRVKRSDAEAT